MNKVVTINLGGCAYQLEEGGYDALQTYLETATARLQGNPDRDEILSDIEFAIAEKFNALLSSHKTVVETKEIAAVLEGMGQIESEPGDASESEESGSGAPDDSSQQEEQRTESGRSPRRLYRIQEGAMVAGVCNGIAAFMNIDATLVRIAFVLLTLLWGFGLIVYVAMAFIVPEARSPEEKAAVSGIPLTAQEFIRRAKEGYYKTRKGFPGSNEKRERKRRFNREMRSHAAPWRYNRQRYWAQDVPYHPGMGFALPFLTLLQGAATVLFIIAIVSLLATGSVWRLGAPAGVPVWILALVLIIVYGILVSPLKFARRSCYYGLSQSRWASPTFFLDTMIWISVVLALLWLAAHYLPELHSAIRNIPGVAHQAADDVRTWWQGW